MSERECMSCGTSLPFDAKFCLKCGSAVTGPTVTEPGDPLLHSLEHAAGTQYELIRLLGRGGMGAVYLAREKALDRLVAIKVLPPEATDDESTERFRREARTAAKLTHPNIVPLYTFGEAAGMMYFVMGFVQGESLAARLKRKGRLAPADVRRLLAETASALHYAHDRGVVHRDIKPDNILIDDETGKPMLTDFGVAKSVASGETLTQLGTALGTPYYMSPEQAAGDKDVDGRSDLYSLGIVGYQLLSGRLPYEGESIRDVLLQHVTKEATPLKALVPDAPDDLIEVIAQCLLKERDKRIGDGRSLQHALRSDSDGEARIPDNIQESVAYLRPLPWAMGGCFYLSYGFAVWNHWMGMAGFAAIGALLPLVALDEKRRGEARRYSWRTLLTHVMRKPKWWTMWWPKRFREPGDLWERLPRAVRQYRQVLGPSAGGFMLLAPVFLRVGSGSPSLLFLDVVLPALVLGVAVPVTGALGWSLLRLNRWARLAGLTRRELSKVMDAGDGHPIWKKANVQKLLLPKISAAEAGVPSAPRTPAELVEALHGAASILEGAGREVAIEAVQAGQDLHGTIQLLDEQIRSLARDVDPAELPRLEEKVRGLGELTESSRDGQRRMHELVVQQLSLAKSLARQLDDAQERRTHLVDLLKTLWMQIANLRAHQVDSAFDSSEISGKIRAISEDAKRYVEASDEMVRLLKE